MNRELIKRLKHQATSYTWNGDGVTEELDEDLFVELIVQECANLCYDRAHAGTQGSYSDAAMTCGNTIVDHFGVEE